MRSEYRRTMLSNSDHARLESEHFNPTPEALHSELHAMGVEPAMMVFERPGLQQNRQ